MNIKSQPTTGPQVQKRPTKKVLVPLLVVISLGAGLQVATQHFAYSFHYSKGLGASWERLYLPWSIITWWQDWHAMYTRQLTASGSLGTMIAAAGLMCCTLAKRIGGNSSKINEHLHGSARWAEKEDILKAGLLGNNQGVYVGAWIDKEGTFHYLRHNGPEHILTFAPTRSGKGLGLVLPTLLSWPHSVVITDLKGELWAMTSGWRKVHAQNKVIRFEPATSNGSACWNPIDEIRIGTDYEVGDAQNLATLIADPEGKGLESHWQKTSQALLVGLILHVIYKLKVEGHVASIPNIDQMLADPNNTIANLLIEMTRYPHVNGINHGVINASARDMLDRPEEEAGSILSTLKSYLSLYRDPVVARNVSSSDFCIKDLMNHEDPVSLYIVTQPNDKNRLQPLVRLLLNMIVRLLADKMEFERVLPNSSAWQRFLAKISPHKAPVHSVNSKKTYKHRLLGMIDEFPSLGKLDILQESLAFVAGYGIKFYLICQDLNQLKSRERGYGPDETITSNCHIQNAFPPNRIETAAHISKLTGITTVIKEQITTSGRRTSLMLNQMSHTYQEIQRPLLTDDECMRLPGPKKNAQGLIEEAGDMLVYVNNIPMIYGKQPLYFQDPIFAARAAVPPPLTSDTLRLRLTESEEIRL